MIKRKMASSPVPSSRLVAPCLCRCTRASYVWSGEDPFTGPTVGETDEGRTVLVLRFVAYPQAGVLYAEILLVPGPGRCWCAAESLKEVPL